MTVEPGAEEKYARSEEDTYAAAVKRCTTEQGLDPVLARLRALNIKHGLDQTGGMTMVVTVPATSGTWAITQHRSGTEHLQPAYNLAFYVGNDWQEGGSEPLHISQMLLDTIIENIAFADEQPWQPGQMVDADGDAVVTWVNKAPRDGFWWVGYMRDGEKYAGVHIDKDGYDQKGRRALTRHVYDAKITDNLTPGHQARRYYGGGDRTWRTVKTVENVGSPLVGWDRRVVTFTDGTHLNTTRKTRWETRTEQA